ncbi:MAG: zf-HC2 domain-containing protein [Gemmatimonadota bacterium]
MSRPETIHCEEALRLVYEYLDGELDPDSTEKIRSHIEVCRQCYPTFNFERIFLDHIRAKGLRAEHSDRLEPRIVEILRGLE